MLSAQDFETVLQDMMRRWDIPGLAIGITSGDEVIYAHSFGVQSLESKVPVTLDSVFSVQSVSKCFVATAVMQLVERGKLDLDTPLVEYLPYFQLDDGRFRQITVRQMLSHTSGMPDIDEPDYIEWVVHPEYDDGCSERFVRSLSAQKLIANPGERFSYSNIAYNVLGDLIAKVTRMPFESAMQDQILIPSEMLHSTFLLTDIPNNLLVWPHLRSPEMRVNPSYPYQRADGPSSFLHTTIMDLCRWCIISLKRGKLSERGILSETSYDLMWTPAVKRGNPPSMYEEMGLGWVLGHFKGVTTICHGGAGFGWTAFLLLMPELQRAAAILCNEESNACYRVVQAAAETIIGETPQMKTVSWMVPISKAAAEGGMDAAYACYSMLKDSGAQGYYFHEDDLDSLALQLLMAKKLDLAIEVLGLNMHVYPDHIESYLLQARLYLQKGKKAKAQESLSKALLIEPTNSTALRLQALF